MLKIFLLSLLLVSCNGKKKSEVTEPVSAVITPVSAPIVSPAPAIKTPTLSEQYLILMQDHRHPLALRPLIRNTDMDGLALQHSKDMANRMTFFGHSGSSVRCADAIKFLGRGNLCGEIVAMGQSTAQQVLNSWLGSSGHRAHIENRRYTHTGVGWAKNGNGTFYWTQIFLEAP